jgi:hypothetical protein
MVFSSVPGGTTVRKSATITIVEETDEIEQDQLQPTETYAATIVTETVATITTATTSLIGPTRDYYNSGSTEDATDTALVIKRLEAVRTFDCIARSHYVCCCIPIYIKVTIVS